MCLVPDPSASDEAGDEGKVKKKQKTMTNKRKATTRVKFASEMRLAFLPIFSRSLSLDNERDGGLVVKRAGFQIERSGFEPWPGPIVLCSWARHFTLTVPLSTQECKWVPANCQGNLRKCWRDVYLRWTSVPSRRSSTPK